MGESLARYAWASVKSEWSRRTWYGKLWFPVWLGTWMIIAFGLTLAALAWYGVPRGQRWALTPEVYRDG